jgi:hypothetical protein
MRNSISMPQGMNAGGPQQLPGGQQLTPQQQQHMQRAQQNEMSRLQMLRQQNNGMEMTPEQTTQMDQAPFPQSLLTNNSQVPKNIKTWGQLKQWVSSNSQAATGIDPNKLLTLQKLHFAQILSVQAKDPNRQNQGQGVMKNPFQQVPQGQVQNAQNLQPGQPGQPGNMPPMRPITAQDIHLARQKLGVQSQSYTDDQIREILRNRQRQILIQTAHQRAQAQQLSANANMASGQNQPIAQPQIPQPQNNQQVKPPPMAQPQPSAVDTPAVAAKPPTGAATAKAGKGAAANKQNSKKRPSTDDTGAAAAAAAAAATAAAQQAQPAAPPANAQRANVPFSQEQFAAMSPQQRLQVEAHMRRQQQNQLRGPILNKAAAEEAWNNHLPPKIMEAYNEISKNAPAAKPVSVSPDQKAIMTQQLQDSLDVLGRLDVLVLHGFGKMQGQERNVKNLLAMRIQLMRQFKPSQEWIVNDQFTITPDYLTGAILFIRKLFQVMIVRMNQARPNGNQAGAAGAAGNQVNPGSTPQLNASNLQQLQAQQEEALRTRRPSEQSATHPAAPFGAPSPSGIPHAYGPGALVPEKLKLPPPKKRKQSHAGPTASPVQATTTAPGAAAKSKQAVADAKTTAAALAAAFKCSVVECQHHFQGFATQAALDKHVENDHQPQEEENIEDPLQFYLESISMGLGLDASGQPIKPNHTTGLPPAMTPVNKPSVASPVKHGLATPVTASTTPMARVTSQLGAKGASPATPAQQLTPNQPTKTIKPSPGKEVQKHTIQDGEAKDLWSECPMSLGTVHDSFTPVFSECRRRGLGYDPFDEFMNTDMFTQDQTEDTPDSWDIALATLTPKDEGKGDVKDGVVWSDWVPWDEDTTLATADWMNIPPEIMLKDGPDVIPGVQVDWESLDRQQKDGTSFAPLPIAPTA